MQNPAIHSIRPAGVILAGGKSRRMGGELKALSELAGKPLLNHVIDRIRPQVEQLCLSVSQPLDKLAGYGLTQVCDPGEDAGPLAGLMSALQAMQRDNDWLLLVPCDAPFVPLDLASRLLDRALETGKPGAVVRYQSELQPTFSLWNRTLLPRLEQAVKVGHMRGFKQFLQGTGLAILDWPGVDPSPFFNINDPVALQAAGQLLAPRAGDVTSC